MADSSISQQDIDAVYPKVAATIADALGCDEDEVKRDSSLINDLGAESIDFLDLVFRLERTFKVKIPRGKIVEDSRGALSEAEFEQKGLVTDSGTRAAEDVPVRGAAGPLPLAAQGRRDPAPVHHRDVLQARGPRAAHGGARGVDDRAARGSRRGNRGMRRVVRAPGRGTWRR